MRRALLAVGAVVVAVPLAAAGVAAWYLNGDAVKLRLIDEVRRATGRELTIAGPVRLTWSLTPTIAVDDVSLANPPGFPQPQMAHVVSIQARLAVLPLLERRVVVDRVAIVSPEIVLAVDGAGRPNWRFDPAAPPPSAPAAPSASAPGPHWRLELGKIEVTDASIDAPQGRLTVPSMTLDQRTGEIRGALQFGLLKLRDVAVTAPSLTGPVHFTAAGSLDQRALALSGTIGSPAALLAGSTPVEVRVEGPGLVATLAGPVGVAGMGTLQARITVTDLAALGPSLPRVTALDASAALSLTPGGVTATGLRVASAQGDLAGDLAWTRAGRPTLRGTLSSTRLDLDALAPARPAATPSAAPAPAPTAAPPSAPEPTRVIPDTRLQLEPLRAMDADLKMTAADIRLGGRDYRAVQAHAVLAGGTLRIDPASMAVGSATARGTLEIQAAAQPPAIHATIEAPALPVGGVMALAGEDADTPGTLDLHADLAGTGATERVLAATLTGQATMALADAHVDNALLERLLAGPIRALGLPADGGGGTTIRCAVLRADAAGGIVRFSTLALDTSKLSLEGSGEVDLGRETIDLHLRPQFRLGGGLSVPLRVRGTLAAPKASLDPGAIASGRVGIMLGGPPPPDTCGPALAAARGEGPAPAPVLAPVEAAPTRKLKPADLLRGLLR